MNSQKPERQLGKLTDVTGRKDGRGFPELFDASIAFDDETTLDLTMPRQEAPEDRARVLKATFERTRFPECPICLAADPTSEEHVPPGAVGGKFITWTCTLCNNEFGSKLEPHLIGWYESSLGAVRLSGSDVPGKRNAGTFLVRQTSEGIPVFVQRGNYDPASDEILASGEFQVHQISHDRNRAILALLKSAYLSACVLLKQIPRTPIAEAVRKELLAARDLPRHAPCVLSDWTRNLYVGRSHSKPEPGVMQLALMKTEDREILILSFNKYISMQWPIDPISPVITTEAPRT